MSMCFFVVTFFGAGIGLKVARDCQDDKRHKRHMTQDELSQFG